LSIQIIVSNHQLSVSLFREHAETPAAPAAFGSVSATMEKVMDKDRAAGIGKQMKGSVKEAAGKVTGDARTQAEGKADKAEGKVQNAVGSAKDAARDAMKKD
jgi:uncharacterized protein YjbJ (UPF0337 family)